MFLRGYYECAPGGVYAPAVSMAGAPSDTERARLEALATDHVNDRMLPAVDVSGDILDQSRRFNASLLLDDGIPGYNGTLVTLKSPNWREYVFDDNRDGQ
jgi:hypothetical protein